MGNKAPFEYEIELELLKDKLAEYQEREYYHVLDDMLGDAYDRTYHEINEAILEAYKEHKSTIVKYDRCIGVSTSLYALAHVFDDVVVISEYNQEEHDYILNDMDLSDKVVFMDDGYRVTHKTIGKVINVIEPGMSEEDYTYLKPAISFEERKMYLHDIEPILNKDCNCLTKLIASLHPDGVSGKKLNKYGEENLTTKEFHYLLQELYVFADSNDMSPETVKDIFMGIMKEYNNVD